MSREKTVLFSYNHSIPFLRIGKITGDVPISKKFLSNIIIGEKNPSNVNFAIIKNQVKFIDTVKYFQQSLASLAKSMTDDERENVKRT